MKLAVSAFALLLATGVAAHAQGTMAPPAKSANPLNSDQCWDLATNSIKASNTRSLTQSPSGAASTGNSSTSVNPSTPPGAAATTGAAPATRPAGMPTC